MLVQTVSMLLETSAGTKVEAFRGKVSKVYQPLEGESKTKRGERWKLQKLILTDGPRQIECVLDNRPETISRQMEGAEIYVVSANGERGIKGVVRCDNDYKNKITPQVKVYDSAEITFNGQPAQSAPPAQQTPPPAQQQRQAPPQQQRTAPTDGNQPPPTGGNVASPAIVRANAMKKFNVRLLKNKAALLRCYDEAIDVVHTLDQRHAKTGGFKASVSDVKEIASLLFIQSGWVEKPGEIAGFPTRPFYDYDVTEEGAQQRTNGANGHTNGHAPEPAGAGTQRQGTPFN